MQPAIANLLAYLRQEGVEHIFGLPGKPLLPLLDCLYHEASPRFVLARDEEGASLMANGYARVSGRLGVCCGTTGGGTTKLVTGVASAYMDSVPLLALTGQVETSKFGRGAFQESTSEGRCLDAVGLFKGITKYSSLVFRPENMGRATRKALRAALSGRRGPVHLNVPHDVAAAEVPAEEALPSAMYRPRSEAFDRRGVKDAIDALVAHGDAAIVAGAGVLDSGASEALRLFAETFSIPVVTTLKGKGALDERHPLCFGVHGVVGSPAALRLLSEKVDVLLVLGSSLNEFATSAWNDAMCPRHVFVQVDIDPDEVGKNHPVDVGIVGDCAHVLTELLYEGRRRRLHPLWSPDELAKRRAAWGLMREAERCLSEARPILPQRAMWELRRAAPDETIFLADAGANHAWATHYLPCHRPGGFISGLGMASMGYAAAAAIGARLASEGSPVVSICGDGGFLMHANEVATAAEYGIPVIWVVLNDARLGAVYFGQNQLMDGRILGCTYDRLPIAAHCAPLGARTHVCTEPGQVERALAEALRTEGRPSVIEVLIDPTEVPPLGGRIRKGSGV